MKILLGFRVLGLLAQLVEQRTFNPTVQGGISGTWAVSSVGRAADF